MRLCVLASGSRGNCLWVEGGATRILIDAGISYRQTILRMAKRDLRLADVHAIIVTHGHQDHIRAIDRLTRSLAIPVYGSGPALQACYIGPQAPVYELMPRLAVNIGELEVVPIPVIHNAPVPLAFAVRQGIHSMLAIGETGRVTRELADWIAAGPDALLLEANHDINMLVANQKLPEFIKQRILATHLSNQTTAKVLQSLSPKTRLVVLLHLSQDNNDPNLVRNICEPLMPSNCRLVIAEQREPTEVFEL